MMTTLFKVELVRYPYFSRTLTFTNLAGAQHALSLADPVKEIYMHDEGFEIIDDDPDLLPYIYTDLDLSPDMIREKYF